MNNNILTITRREGAAYFNSAIAYIFATVFVLLNGGLYMAQFFLIGRADMRPFFSMLPFLLAVFIPAVSMRLWAEERRGNTLEMLLTFPMQTHELVLGKFFAALLFYLAALAGTLSIPLMLAFLGRPDFGAILGGYTGAVLIGAFFLAIGIFISGFLRDQITAFILGMMICFSLYFAGTEFVSSSIDGWVPGLGTLIRLFVGAARHFDAFAKGVLDMRDVLYFVLGAALFLVLNGFWLEGRMRPKARSIFTSAVLVSAGIFVLGNWFLSGFSLGRFDLTQGHIYTVSRTSKDILRALKSPVTVKLYISSEEKMPAGMKTLEADVSGKLEEFRLASGGKFEYKILHMEAVNAMQDTREGRKDSLESELSQKGVEPFQVQSIEADEVGVKLIYSSMSIAYKEKAEELIPRIMPETLDELEYLLISKIFRLTLAQAPRVAIVAPYEERNLDPQMQMILAQLTGGAAQGYREDQYELLPMALKYEGYETDRIRLSEEEPIPAGTKTLVVVEPSHFSKRQLFEISRFVAAGGSLLLAVQNYEYQYQPSGHSLTLVPSLKSPGTNALTAAWGLKVSRKILMDEQHEVINMRGASRGLFDTSMPVKLPLQILIPPAGMNADFAVTARLSSLFYLWGTALDIDNAKAEAQGLKVTTLLKSSQASWEVPFKRGPMDAATLLETPPVAHGPFPLAVYAEGMFKDVFAGKDAPAWKKPAIQKAGKPAAGQKPPVAENPPPVTPAPGKVMLLGAATMFQKQLAQGGGHLNFFLNAVDAMTLGNALVEIRSQQATDRSIGRVSTGVKLGWRLFVTLFVPVLIVLIGSFRVFLRRQVKTNYLRSLK